MDLFLQRSMIQVQTTCLPHPLQCAWTFMPTSPRYSAPLWCNMKFSFDPYQRSNRTYMQCNIIHHQQYDAWTNITHMDDRSMNDIASPCTCRNSNDMYVKTTLSHNIPVRGSYPNFHTLCIHTTSMYIRRENFNHQTVKDVTVKPYTLLTKWKRNLNIQYTFYTECPKDNA